MTNMLSATCPVLHQRARSLSVGELTDQALFSFFRGDFLFALEVLCAFIRDMALVLLVIEVSAPFLKVNSAALTFGIFIGLDYVT